MESSSLVRLVTYRTSVQLQCTSYILPKQVPYLPPINVAHRCPYLPRNKQVLRLDLTYYGSARCLGTAVCAART
jgi:hypothetical protein